MKRTLKIMIAIVLFCASIVSFAPGAFAYDNIEEKYDSEVSNVAVNYLTQLTKSMYLYEPLIKSVNTIKSVSTDSFDEKSSISMDGKQVSIGELKRNIDFIEDTAEYYKYFRNKLQIERSNFSQSYKIQDMEFNGNYAIVAIDEVLSFYYDDIPIEAPNSGELTTMCENYKVELLRVNGTWLVINLTTESNGLFCTVNRDAFNLSDKKAELDYCIDHPSSDTTLVAEANNSSTRGPFDSTRSYNRANATAYAYTYSSSSIGTSIYNGNFYDSTSSGGDCTNFTSQCIWAGFAGSNSTSAINNKLTPMDDSGSYVWYRLHSNWVGTFSFVNYINSAATSTSETRLIASVYDIGYGANLSGVTNYLYQLPGAVLMVDGGGDNYGHAIFAIDLSSSSRSDLYYCAHSPCVKNARLSDSFPVCPIKVVIPSAFNEVSSCTNSAHTYSTIPTSNGTDSICNNCGYCRMYVTSNLVRPVAAGSTVTLASHAMSGTSSFNCYRIAMSVTKPSGSVTWYEFNNTASISKNVVLNETGLYTITVRARDKNTTNSDSHVSEHVFTVRAY